MTLLELQRSMAEAVMRPLTAGWGMQGKDENGKPMHGVAAEFIKPNDRLSSFERLEIYNRQYWFRILGSLAEDFPGLATVLGEKQFDALSLAYLKENPSVSFTLRNLGSKMEAWLMANPKWGGSRQELALDVVRLEWAYIEAFDNAQERALTLADFSRLGEDSYLALQPHVRLLRLQYPVDEFIIAVHREQLEPSVASNAVTKVKKSGRKRSLTAMKPAETLLAVHRFDQMIYYKRLEPEAFLLLQSLRDGLPLGASLEKALESTAIPENDRPDRVQQWFSTWAELGWFCAANKSLVVA